MADGERRGLLDNSAGAGLAASAFMGPAGLFLGPSIKRARERRELENKLLRDSIAAREEFTDLLGRRVEVPRGPGGAPGQLTGLWQDPATGERLPMSPSAGAAGFDEMAYYQTPEGQQKVMQLMSRMSPDLAGKVAESILPGTTDRATSTMKEMAAMGMPMTLENLRAYHEATGKGESPIEAALAAILLQQRQQELEGAQTEAEREQQEEETEHRNFRNNLQTSGDSLMELARVNERLMGREGLKGYLARPGVPFGQMRRDIASSFDEGIATDIDTFNSLANQIAISRLDTESFDAGTNQRFQAFTSTKPSFDAVGPANYVTIRNNLQGVLLADDAAPAGAKLPKNVREKYQREVNRLRGISGGQPTSTRSVTLPDGRIVDNVPPNVTDQQVIQMMGRQ